MLGAVFHRKHPGRHVREIGCGLSARSDGLHIDHLAGLHEQLRQPRNLHDLQSRV